MSGGIYRIRNTVTGACYIGASLYLETRMALHRRDLRNGKHTNRMLQMDWQRYGEEAFTFRVVERIPNPADIRQRETHYLLRLREEAGRGRNHYNGIYVSCYSLHTEAKEDNPQS